MPRRLRKAAGGVVFHVLNRAVARIRILKGDGDYAAFMRTLEEAMKRHPVELFAYCLMPNHWHLVVRPRKDGDLSQFMAWLTMTHAQRWRTSHQTVGYGPLYQGRFRSFPIEEDEHLLTVLRYVERNPVRAGLVERAEDWAWSSLHRRMHGSEAQRALLSAWPVPVPQDWVEWVNRPQTGAEEEALAGCIARSRPYGDPAWRERTAQRLGLDSSLRPRGRPRKRGESPLSRDP